MHLVDIGELHFAIIKVILALNININLLRFASLFLSFAPNQRYE